MVKLPQMDPEQVAIEIQNFIIKKVIEMNKTGVVIGLSGGIDSSIVAVLCKRALTGTPHEVSGYILPGSHSEETKQDKDDAANLCSLFNINFSNLPIDDLIFQTVAVTNRCHEISQRATGNVASRVRSNILSTFAEIENKLVCGTGNKDEDYGIGYYTLFGDGAVHMNPIGNLSKRLVYQMGNYLNIPLNIIGKKPSARLEPGQTDLEDLGYHYSTVELVIEGMEQGINPSKFIEYLEEKEILYDKNRFNDISEVVSDIFDRHLQALSKARLIHPEVANVTLTY